MANEELVKEFIKLHSTARQLIDEEKVEEARQKYFDLVDTYHKIDKSTLEPFHKELAYDQVTKVFNDLKDVKKRKKIPVNLIAAGILVMILSFVIVFNPGVVGLTSYEGEMIHPVNLTFTESGISTVALRERPLSISVSGRVEGNAKLYLKQGERLTLIFDSEKSPVNNGTFIAVCEETCKVKHDGPIVELYALIDGGNLSISSIIYGVERKDNSAPVWSGKTRQFNVKRGSLLKVNLDEYFMDPDRDDLVYLSTSAPGLEVLVESEQVIIKPTGSAGEKKLTFIASDLADLTKIPVTIVVN